ncbi:MAG: carboxyl transferase [Clostridia bacterium]|nr:carboxyl transferase [Clostridia bacterium]
MNIIKQNTLEQYEELLAGGGTAYDRVANLFDAGTFVELGRFVKKATTEFDNEPGNEFEGVVTGYGAIDGKLVFAFVQDFSRMKGAMSEAHAKKIVAVYDSAMKSGAPVIGVFDSAGAKVLEGVAALSGYGSIMKAAAQASGVIPQIAVIAGTCSGSLATIASMSDVVIGAKSGSLYINSPFAQKAKGEEKAGTIEYAAENGAVSVVTETVEEALVTAKKLIVLFPSNNVEGTAYNEVADSANRLVAGEGALTEIVSELVDAGSAVEFGKEYAPDTATTVASIGGITVGVVAAGGKLTAKGAEKAAKFVSFCDSFSIPVVTLVDCEGTAACACSEKAPFSSKLARLASAYAVSTTAKVSVVTGKAYGTVFTVFGSKTLGADVAFATPNASISVMPTEAAVEFIYADQIKTAADPMAEKEAVTAEWSEKVCSPVTAARNGDLDDIIAASELRMRVAAALEMLSGKATTAPYKKHGNLPL